MAPSRPSNQHKVIRRRQALGSLRRAYKNEPILPTGQNDHVPVLATVGVLGRMTSHRRLKERLHPLHLTRHARPPSPTYSPYRPYTPYRPYEPYQPSELESIAEASGSSSSLSHRAPKLPALDDAVFEPLGLDSMEFVSNDRHGPDRKGAMRPRSNAISLHLNTRDYKVSSEPADAAWNICTLRDGNTTDAPTDLDHAMEEAFEAADRFAVAFEQARTAKR
ncbi:MAG: hypothetical protein Q9159_000304 [Coniocarpon cinnabarinum]